MRATRVQLAQQVYVALMTCVNVRTSGRCDHEKHCMRDAAHQDNSRYAALLRTVGI